MKVERKDKDSLNTSLKITIESKDYADKYASEIKKYKANAQLKGFRKGRTPVATVKKFYGKNIVTEAVNEQLQKGLFDYISDNELNVIGDPLPSADQTPIDFDAFQPKDYSFSFDLGLAPDFEIEGISDKDTYEQFNVSVEDKVIQEEIDAVRKRLGVQKEIEDSIEEKDIITINAFELGDNGKKKEGGHETSFKVMVDLLEDDVKKEVLSNQKGGKLIFDVDKFEKDRDEAYINKYILTLEDGKSRDGISSNFEGFIDVVSRTVMADFNEEFFKKYDPSGEIDDEEKLKVAVEKNISSHYDLQTKRYLQRTILEELIQKNTLEFPEEFLLRWLKVSNDKVEASQIVKEFPDFKKNLTWSLIKNKVAKNNDIKVEPEEIKAAITNQVKSYFGAYPMEQSYLDNMVNRLLQDQQQVNKAYEELLSERVFDVIESKVKTKSKKISSEEFKSKVEELNKANA